MCNVLHSKAHFFNASGYKGFGPVETVAVAAAGDVASDKHLAAVWGLVDDFDNKIGVGAGD